MENKNLTLYAKMAEPPKSALKTIQAGRLRGKSDINPQWRYKVMTENFGICGLGWKYSIDKTWLEPGANGEVVANAQVSVYVRDPETKEWSDAIVGIGGSMFVANEKNGPFTSDEAFKMAVTDAFSVALKFLGVAAAIYEGRWDGSKYSKADYDSSESKPQPTLSPEAERERNAEMANNPEYIQLKNELTPFLNAPFIAKDSRDNIREAIDNYKVTYMKKILSWCNSEREKAMKAASSVTP